MNSITRVKMVRSRA